MKKTAYILFSYATAILIGGVIGYLKAGSHVSLITSLCSFSLLSIGIFALAKHRTWGYPYSITVVGALAVFFIYRFTKTLSFMPSGMMALVSLLYVTTLLFLMKNSMKKSYL